MSDIRDYNIGNINVATASRIISNKSEIPTNEFLFVTNPDTETIKYQPKSRKINLDHNIKHIKLSGQIYT